MAAKARGPASHPNSLRTAQRNHSMRRLPTSRMRATLSLWTRAPQADPKYGIIAVLVDEKAVLFGQLPDPSERHAFLDAGPPSTATSALKYIYTTLTKTAMGLLGGA